MLLFLLKLWTLLALSSGLPGEEPSCCAVEAMVRSCGECEIDGPSPCDLPDGWRLVCCVQTESGCRGCLEDPAGNLHCFRCTPEGCEIDPDPCDEECEEACEQACEDGRCGG